jgi:polynucleotide 5'-triphosphatase
MSSQWQGTPIDYKHLYLVDSFYESDERGDRDKTRVTRDEKTGSVIECVKKLRLGDLNIWSPKRNADWRISVNLEVPGLLSRILKRLALPVSHIVPHPVGTATYQRRKDRMSYTHEEFNIDLTQVTAASAPGAPVCTRIYN